MCVLAEVTVHCRTAVLPVGKKKGRLRAAQSISYYSERQNLANSME